MLESECIVTGAGSALLRLSLVLAPADRGALAGATLVVRSGGVERRHSPLPPAPGNAPAAEGVVTLGFALGRADPATASLSLLLGGRSLAVDRPMSGLPLPVALRVAKARALQLEAAVDRAAQDRTYLELALVRAQRRAQAGELELERSRASRGRAIAERDDALGAAARAAAAAHDATARAETARARAAAPSTVWAPRSRRGTAALACALGTAAITCGVLAWLIGGDAPNRREAVAAVAAGHAGGATAADAALARRLRIPPRYVALYQDAARRYGLDWTWLAAVGAAESDHGQSPLRGVLTGLNPRGAAGPAQFLLATWKRFGVDGDGDGVRDPHDADDAVPAMASYLRASGAPEDWGRALHTYNHSDVYVRDVRRRAQLIARLAR